MMAPVVYTGELLRTPSPDGWWSAGSSFMFDRIAHMAQPLAGWVEVTS